MRVAVEALMLAAKLYIRFYHWDLEGLAWRERRWEVNAPLIAGFANFNKTSTFARLGC